MLDPFWGTGNTTLAAIHMHRSSIGIEIEPEYLRLGKRRLPGLIADSTMEFSA
ncbi:MAG: DNA methyltransferase [Acidobacteriota bacterium]